MEGQGIPITPALHEIILQIKHPLKHTFLAWLKITHDFFFNFNLIHLQCLKQISNPGKKINTFFPSKFQTQKEIIFFIIYT